MLNKYRTNIKSNLHSITISDNIYSKNKNIYSNMSFKRNSVFKRIPYPSLTDTDKKNFKKDLLKERFENINNHEKIKSHGVFKKTLNEKTVYSYFLTNKSNELVKQCLSLGYDSNFYKITEQMQKQ